MSPQEQSTTPKPPTATWTFLTNHSHVLMCLQQDAQMRVRDIASRVGITERAVQRIIQELEEADVVSRTREGRRNRYRINRKVHLRHTLESHRTVGDLLNMVSPDT